jgi:hypothetical protein
LGKILPPLQGLIFLERLTQGKRSGTSAALGYHLSGLQPFESASISVHQRLKILRSMRSIAAIHFAWFAVEL